MSTLKTQFVIVVTLLLALVFTIERDSYSTSIPNDEVNKDLMTNNVVEEVGVGYLDPLDCSTNASICNIGEILPRSVCCRNRCVDISSDSFNCGISLVFTIEGDSYSTSIPNDEVNKDSMTNNVVEEVGVGYLDPLDCSTNASLCKHWRNSTKKSLLFTIEGDSYSTSIPNDEVNKDSMTNNVVEEVGVDYRDPLDCSTNASICNNGEILPRSVCCRNRCVDLSSDPFNCGISLLFTIEGDSYSTSIPNDEVNKDSMTNNVVEEVGVDYRDPLDCSTNASICNIGEILPRSISN
ncbi:hypothetical protein RYX36_006264 [Vicia faba]